MADSLEETKYEALGQSEAFLEFQERLSRAAKVERPILLLGERGSGKELAASKLHYLSPRWQEPLVTLNCSALAPGLIESELFGHEAGAFTGAVSRRTGRFEAAHGGTLFLDEVGAVPVVVQEKILRVVEYGTFERVGNTEPIRVDVRIVGATNADLVGMAGEGSFKRDLLDRLSFEVLFLPPLRERQEDILLLSNHFASRMAHELGREEVPELLGVGDDARLLRLAGVLVGQQGKVGAVRIRGVHHGLVHQLNVRVAHVWSAGVQGHVRGGLVRRGVRDALVRSYRITVIGAGAQQQDQDDDPTW